ncbi:MAG: transketolase family protein, partial [Actinobacteria bacterium]|nr:transketolase family protein [Actinomycetota bacterium]
MQAIAMREAYGRLLVELAGQNEKIVVLDADMAQSCGLQHFRDAFPDRFFNIGIAEQNMMGIAAGLAAYGKIPFVNSFACFLSTRSCDQLRVAVAYGKLNVKIVAGHGGISVGEDGATHQGLEDIAIVRAIPNMV